MIFEKVTAESVSDLLLIEERCHLTPWNREVFERCFKMGYVTITVALATKMVGFLVYSLIANECHILNLCIHPSFQRQGCGLALLNYVLDEVQARGGQIAFLEVRSSNTGAIALYDSVGFIKIGERKGYYICTNGREDAWVFAKDLGVA